MLAATPLPRLVDDRETLLCSVALALHVAGAPAHRLEDTVNALARRVGIEARLTSAPTSLMLSLGPVEQGRTSLIRVEPGGLDLGRMATVDHICTRLLSGDLSPDDALAALRAADSAPPRFSAPWLVPGFMLTGMAATAIMGGATADVIAAAVLGAIMSLFLGLTRRGSRLDYLQDLLAGCLGATTAGLWSWLVWPIDTSLVTIATLIVLVPGLTLTTAITELATRHLVSGTARLSAAGVTFASLGLGAVAGSTFTAALSRLGLGPALPWVSAWGTELPMWLDWLFIGLAAVSFTLLMQARWRNLPEIALTCAVGFGALQLCQGWVAPPMDAAIGGLAVAMTSNAIARLFNRPAAVSLVPGLFMLVPGSMGFKSLIQVLDAQVAIGVDELLQAPITAVALAAGVLMAQVLVPPRRTL
ncbi:MAG: threonine/serine exporter ThrE family protein [Myxococcota bacterium]